MRVWSCSGGLFRNCLPFQSGPRVQLRGGGQRQRQLLQRQLGHFPEPRRLGGRAGHHLFQPTNNAIFGVRPAIQLAADTFDPANDITNVTFCANGIQIGQTNAPPYSLLWSNVPGGSYALTARAMCSSGLATNSSAVTVRVSNGGSPFLTISPIGNGGFAIAATMFLVAPTAFSFSPT